jgi:hypothetical protein
MRTRCGTTAVALTALLLAACGGDTPAATEDPDVPEEAVGTEADEGPAPSGEPDEGDEAAIPEVDEAAVEAEIVEAYRTFLSELDEGWPDVLPADLGVDYVGSVTDPDEVQRFGQREPADVQVVVDHDAGTAELTDCVKDARAYFPLDQEVTDEEVALEPIVLIEADASLERDTDEGWQVVAYREIAEHPTEEGFPFTRCVPEPAVEVLVDYLTALYDTQGSDNDPDAVRPFVSDLHMIGVEKQLHERREQDARLDLELAYAISPTHFEMYDPDRDLTVVEVCATVFRWIDTVAGEERARDGDELQMRVALDVTDVERPHVFLEEEPLAEPSCDHVDDRPFSYPPA